MGYSKDENLFFEMLSNEDAVLYLDNDMCYITVENGDDEPESESFDFGPSDLVYLFGEKLGYTVEPVWKLSKYYWQLWYTKL